MANPDPVSAIAPRTALGQKTLATPVQRQGVGLHSGAPVGISLEPAPVGAGRYFVRSDLAGNPEIPASLEMVDQTILSTELGRGETRVRTVEHLLAALVSAGIDNLAIHIHGPEVPLLDGSAQGWVEAIQAAGVIDQESPAIAPVQLSQPVSVQEGDAWVAAFPAAACRLTYGIDFEVPAIGQQWFSWQPNPADFNDFATEIAPARTFGLAHQIDYLRAQGLIKGGSLDNALVCSQAGWVNPPLRFANEPVRHKLLDLIGDLSLLGVLPQAHVVAYKASHRLHVNLARAIQALTP